MRMDSSVYTAPVGLFGVLIRTNLVLGDSAASKVSGSGCKVSMLQRAGTSLPYIVST